MAAKKAAPKKSKSKSKQVVTWDDELAKYATAAAEMEKNTGGGQFFSLQGGTLSWQDAPIPNNEMVVVILDAIFENVYYEGRFDPDNPAPPTCFAFARDEDELAPHDVIVKAGQNQIEDFCVNCEHAQWGTADTGRGKACSNTRRLAMIPAGKFDRNGELEIFDESHFAKTEIGFMKLPVTSVKGYASFVKQVAGSLKRPPFGIITRVEVIPDSKTQFRVMFEPVEKLGNDAIEVIMERREEAMSTIDFPYPLEFDAPEKPARKKSTHKKVSKSATKPAAPKRKQRKY